ncbi:MAG: hypothetical protein ACREIA_06385 [Opitutaceae bacterium]
MSAPPVIAFGQQPCGIFPKRFLVAKVLTARRLQQEIGGEIVFFFHDSDHDPRETRTLLRHRTLDTIAPLNFEISNKLQRRFSPLHLKRIAPDWHARMARQLPAYVDGPCMDAFKSTEANNVAGFCLELYRRLGLLDGVRVVRSSDREVRCAACEVDDFFVDAPHEGEIVRARCCDGALTLHEGGDRHIAVAPCAFSKEQVSPTRDTRLRWMQSVLHCTHYIAGAGEQAYLDKEACPEIEYINRDPIDRSDEAFIDFPL